MFQRNTAVNYVLNDDHVIFRQKVCVVYVSDSDAFASIDAP